MKTCLVSMISDQTIPNILVASEIKPDHLLLISTESMEKKGKSDAILNSLHILGMDYKDRNDRIIVPENSIPDFHEKVIEWIKANRKNCKFIVNLTGGTKLMSLAAYEIFKIYGAEMVYVPIPENLYFPMHRPNEIVTVPLRLSVEAYLAAYGVSIKNLKDLDAKKQAARMRKETTYFILDNYKELEALLQKMGSVLRDLRKDAVKKGYNLSFDYGVRSSCERNLLDRMEFDYKDRVVSKKIDVKDWDYLRGGWLEERLFLALESVLPETSDISLGIQSQVDGNPNEYDVLATFENVLYVVECKSLQAPEGSEKEVGGTINDFLYKLGALRQNFGLTPRGILATTSRNVLDERDRLKRHLEDRGRLFNTRILPLWQIEEPEGWLKENVFKI